MNQSRSSSPFSVPEIRYHNTGVRGMLPETKGTCPYLYFPAFREIEEIIHGFSTRLGGVSEGDLSSMNLSFSRGDKPENVRTNYQRVAEAIGFQTDQVVCTVQTHTTNVKKVSAADRGNGLARPQAFHDVDGLITDSPGVILTAFFADCVPLFLIDPVHHAIGLSHSGWKGTAAQMGRVTIECMREHFGSDPAELYAGIGPSICRDCYEVSEEVIEAFRGSYPSDRMDSFVKTGKRKGKYQLDLWEANRQLFLLSGLQKDHIFLPNICTCCNPEVLFSHRASQGRRGNLAAFLGLRDTQ